VRGSDVCYITVHDGTANYHHHHHHKHPGLGHLARSVSRVKVALSIVSLVSQLFSFRVGCKGMILKGLGFVALQPTKYTKFKTKYFTPKCSKPTALYTCTTLAVTHTDSIANSTVVSTAVRGVKISFILFVKQKNVIFKTKIPFSTALHHFQ
jgi:hypothetical protein